MRGVTTATLALVALAAPPARGAEISGAVQAEALARQAIEANRTIDAVEARIRALESRVRRAGAWLYPMAAVEYSNVPIDSWALGDHPMSGLQVRLEQTFPFPGKIRLREEVARARVEQARHGLVERKLQLGAMVKRAYFSLALVRQLRAVTVEHIALVDQFTDVVRATYEVGRAQQYELLRLQVLRGRLRDELERFDRDANALLAAVNAALARPIDKPVETPERLSELPPRWTAAQLIATSERSRPRLKELGQEAETQRLAARLAAREGYPDITLWGAYRFRMEAGSDPGTDFVSFGVAIPIPLFYGRRATAEKNAALAEAQAAAAEQGAALDDIRGEIGEALAGWKRAVQEARTYRDDLIPRAEQTLESTSTAYQVGQADFASLYQSELQLLDFARNLRRAEAQAALSRIALEALVGAELRDAPAANEGSR